MRHDKFNLSKAKVYFLTKLLLMKKLNLYSSFLLLASILVNNGFLLLLLMSSFVKPSFAQGGQSKITQQKNANAQCGTTEYLEWLQAQYPNEFPEETQFEQWMQTKIAATKAQKNPSTVFQIPIIFHIIHNGEPIGQGTNVHSEYIYAQIEQLNDDFRKKTGTCGNNYHPDGVDTNIEFYPVIVDNECNDLVEPGINRINRNYFNFPAPPYDKPTMNIDVKPETIWNPNQFYNVWVAPLGGGLLGFAQFPSNSGFSDMPSGGPADTDGSVITYSSVGSSATPFPSGAPYNKGRTLTHETGHWLGLHHIWGSSGTCGNDYCSDTPTQAGPSSGCPINTTCDGIQDMAQNYMDYSWDVCTNIFTNDQALRMQTVLLYANRRNFTGDCTPTIGICSPPPSEPNGVYDVRFLVKEANYISMELFVDIEVRADETCTHFNISDQNYRFSFRRNQLANPEIDQELKLSGATYTPDNVLNSFYAPHTLTGSLDTVVSYNVELSGGRGYPLNSVEYVKVGRLKFDILDPYACLELIWHTKAPQDFPPTFIGEKYPDGTLASAAEGTYNHLSYCPIFGFEQVLVARCDVASTYENTPVNIDILANDYDPAGLINPSSITLLTTPLPSEGTVTINQSGTLTFSPTTNFYGLVYFTYQVCNSFGICDNTVVNVVVHPVDLPPVAVADFYTTNQGVVLDVPSPFTTDDPILANDYEPDGEGIVLNISSAETITSNVDPNNSLTLFPNGDIQYMPSADFVGTDSFNYEICDDEMPLLCVTGTIYITVESCVDIQLAVFLEGCYNTTLTRMDNLLNLLPGSSLHRGVLPGQEKFNINLPGTVVTPLGQPYDVAPWNYNGLEGTFDAPPWFYAPGSTAPVGDPIYAIYHQDVVDWVLVRLRTGIPPDQMTTIKTAAALLLRDGAVRFLQPCILREQDVPNNMIYAQIDHRNHIAVMTPEPVDISSGSLFWDFRTQQSYTTFTSFGQKEITSGTFAMYAGDSDQIADFPSYDINGLDNNLWSIQNGSFDSYLPGDYNMTSDVNGSDKILWSTNNGIASRVPK